MSGTVYFIQSLAGGPIKIGWSSTSAESRLSGIQTGNPYRLGVLFSMPGTRGDESYLHWWFRSFRSHGEWFWPAGPLMEFIEDLRLCGPDENWRAFLPCTATVCLCATCERNRSTLAECDKAAQKTNAAWAALAARVDLGAID